jgi:cation transport ATPase
LLLNSDSHVLVSLLLIGAATLASVFVGESPWAYLASALLLGISWALSPRLLSTLDSTRSAFLDELRGRLSLSARVLPNSGPGHSREIEAASLRAGQEVEVGAGEFVAADGSVSSGSAKVRLWPGADFELVVQPGSRVVAGAEVVSGTVRIVCTKTGDERAFGDLALNPRGSVAEQVFGSHAAALFSTRVAPATAVLCGAMAYLQGGSYPLVLGLMGSVWGALASPFSRKLQYVLAQSWLVKAAKRGVVFSGPRLVDQAGQVTAAVFCSRGTVLNGQPEIAEVHGFRGVDKAKILALAAGSESVVHHPIAAAVARAARARQIAPDVCRGHHNVPGQGITCVSSAGDRLVVGSREFLLEQRISIALSEETLRSLETRGLSALLVAQNDHLIGVLALQDSLRAGARATIQLLIDEGIEPILISSESRATTEAVGHALSCEHVRPEIPGRLRAQEVTSLRESGATVAVIGTVPRDETALGAASVPIILFGASLVRKNSPHPHERAIGLATSQILTAAVALLVARRMRHYGVLCLVSFYLPVALGVLATVSQLAPLYLAPMIGAVIALILTVMAQRWTAKSIFPTAADAT